MLISEASEKSGIPPATIRNWINAGYIASTKVGGKWYIDYGSLKNYIAVCQHDHRQLKIDISKIRETLTKVNTTIEKIKAIQVRSKKIVVEPRVKEAVYALAAITKPYKAKPEIIRKIDKIVEKALQDKDYEYYELAENKRNATARKLDKVIAKVKTKKEARNIFSYYNLRFPKFLEKERRIKSVRRSLVLSIIMKQIEDKMEMEEETRHRMQEEQFLEDLSGKIKFYFKTIGTKEPDIKELLKHLKTTYPIKTMQEIKDSVIMLVKRERKERGIKEKKWKLNQEFLTDLNKTIRKYYQDTFPKHKGNLIISKFYNLADSLLSILKNKYKLGSDEVKAGIVMLSSQGKLDLIVVENWDKYWPDQVIMAKLGKKEYWFDAIRIREPGKPPPKKKEPGKPKEKPKAKQDRKHTMFLIKLKKELRDYYRSTFRDHGGPLRLRWLLDDFMDKYPNAQRESIKNWIKDLYVRGDIRLIEVPRGKVFSDDDIIVVNNKSFHSILIKDIYDILS